MLLGASPTVDVGIRFMCFGVIVAVRVAKGRSCSIARCITDMSALCSVRWRTLACIYIYTYTIHVCAYTYMYGVVCFSEVRETTC